MPTAAWLPGGGSGVGGVPDSKAVPTPMGKLCGKELNDIHLDSLFLKIGRGRLSI